MPRFAVIIPAYNAMAYLSETLESVLNQTFTDFEVLIINDGSSDV
jgi:glycosyltransferase involved in cell wall biosynthesis